MEYIVKRKDGMIEIWNKNESFHTWKDRNYEPVLQEVITEEEYLQRQAKAKAKAENDKKIKAEIEAEEKKYQKWADNLPKKIKLPHFPDPVFLNSFGYGVFDDTGNFLFSLPEKPIFNYNRFIDYIEKELEDWLNNFCE